MGVTVAIHQPNYIPWMGYFYKMAKSDVFVLLDNVQFPKESPAARNQIKGKNGEAVMLSVSVKKSQGAFQTYRELGLEYQTKWHHKHLNQMRDAYARSPFFKPVFAELEPLLKPQYSNLAELNIALIRWMVSKLGLKTRLEVASEHDDGTWGTRNDRNASICRFFGGTRYLSGSGARKYNDEAVFGALDIELAYSDFTHPVYEQINGPFIPNLSLLDAFFNLGFEETQHLFAAHTE